MKTIGISPKVLAPVVALLATFAANWIASGELDRTELAQLVAAAITAVFGWLASPGTVDVEVGTASDTLLQFPEGKPPPAA